MDSFEKYEQKPDKAPFKKWENSDLKGISSELFSLPDHPDLVIRKSFDLPKKNEKKEGKTTAEMIDFLTKRAKAFQDFGKRYGIRIAKTNYFVGNDPKFKTNIPKEESPAFMAATERISGENFAAMREVDEKAAAEMDAIFSSLFLGLYESYNENGHWWGDSGNGQVMYGTAPNEKQPHAYVVDVDPLMTNWNNVPEEAKESVFWEELEWVLNGIREMEKKIKDEPKRFEKTRKTLAGMIAKMPIPNDEKSQTLRESMINAI